MLRTSLSNSHMPAGTPPIRSEQSHCANEYSFSPRIPGGCTFFSTDSVTASTVPDALLTPGPWAHHRRPRQIQTPRFTSAQYRKALDCQKLLMTCFPAARRNFLGFRRTPACRLERGVPARRLGGSRKAPAGGGNAVCAERAPQNPAMIRQSIQGPP